MKLKNKRYLVCEKCKKLFVTHTGGLIFGSVLAVKDKYLCYRPGYSCDVCDGRIVCVDENWELTKFSLTCSSKGHRWNTWP
jgi:hypothetical protein